jgi:hypothetical protein
LGNEDINSHLGVSLVENIYNSGMSSMSSTSVCSGSRLTAMRWCRNDVEHNIMPHLTPPGVPQTPALTKTINKFIKAAYS